VQAKQAERAAGSELNEQWVLDGLRGIAENPKATDSARARCYELIGKHRGMFVDKHEHSGSLIINKLVESESDD